MVYNTTAETVRILRYNSIEFLSIGALLIHPVSAVRLSNFLVDQSVVRELSIRLFLLAKSSGLPLKPFIEKACLKFSEMVISVVMCFLLYVSLLVLSKAAILYSVDYTYSRKNFDLRKFCIIVTKMENENHTWMYNRTYPNRVGLSKVMTLDDFLTEGTIRCSCWNYKYCKLLSPDVVTLYLYKKGFMVNYTVWTAHGESSDANDFDFQNYVESPIRENNVESSRYSEMVRDAFGTHSGSQNEPNDEAKHFYEQLKEASHPLFHIEEFSKGKKTNNSGVWVKGGDGVDYYSVLHEILELDYYVGWPKKSWLSFGVVIKTKPVGRVEAEDALNVAYQNDISSVKERMDDELAGMLQHNEGLYEEFDPSELRLIVNDYGEGKYGANDKEDPTDENEISEEELLDENETSDEKESMDEYESSDGEELMNDYETTDED
ncbi:putative late blight resistance protein -like protein R1B-23-like [Capsicum annuum]|nr:putative late blight resistance protein -like protein R1B-23-like [Capsicum annuum]